ncbi:MAG: hypothetical protein NWE89_10105 [Candidatus Bathyarchaeota archaeon]|nr:hypothetical protein [Candidatus Bathyarchaeota archaeon]
MAPKETVNAFIEERRREILRLMEGAMIHLHVDKYDVSVLKRKGIDIYDSDRALFAVKADVSKPIDSDGEAFIIRNLRDRGYTVKTLSNKGDRILLLV